MSTKYTKEVLEEAVRNSESFAGVLRFLNLKQAGGTQTNISKRIKMYQIDTSHFTGARWNKGKTFESKRLTPEQILTVLPEGSRRQKVSLLRRALTQRGVPHICVGLNCPNPQPEWAGKPLVLEVDHIDGDWLNNLQENLRYLCPNCHSQTDTSRSWKNTKSGRK